MSRPNGSDPIERLRAVAPVRAHDVPDASLARVSARVEEHVMTDIQQTAASRRRRPLALVGGLTMAAALAVAVAAGSNLGGGLPAPTDEPGNPAAGGGMAMCLAYDAANLPTMEVVFDGTVTAINGDQVTFQVNEGWKGADGSITLTALDPNVALIGPMPDFEVGGRYLVTAAEGNVNACGYTLDYDAGEAADWAAAFED